MILNKVAVPVGVDPKSYCDAMLLGITNDKYCSLRSNFKQVMFEQFQGELCNKIDRNCNVLPIEYDLLIVIFVNINITKTIIVFFLNQ